jgi:hypothetical protein
MLEERAKALTKIQGTFKIRASNQVGRKLELIDHKFLKKESTERTVTEETTNVDSSRAGNAKMRYSL